MLSLNLDIKITKKLGKVARIARELLLKKILSLHVIKYIMHVLQYINNFPIGEHSNREMD